MPEGANYDAVTIKIDPPALGTEGTTLASLAGEIDQVDHACQQHRRRAETRLGRPGAPRRPRNSATDGRV